jgi:uncharacterized protein DUF5665
MPKRKTTRKTAPKQTADEIQLAKEVRTLSQEVRKLKNLEFVRILKRPWKFLLMSLLKGIMVGFGSVLGATVLVAIFIYILAKISFVPIIGDFVEGIMEEIGQTEEVESDIFDQFN